MFPAVHWLSEQLLLSSSMLVWLQSGASSPMLLPSPRSPGISSSSEPSGPQDSKMSPLRSSWSCWLLTWGRSSTSWLVECCWCKYGGKLSLLLVGAGMEWWLLAWPSVCHMVDRSPGISEKHRHKQQQPKPKINTNNLRRICENEV